MQLRRRLADLPNGAIVQVNGRWGVKCATPDARGSSRRHIVDFWDGGREYVSKAKLVDVLSRGEKRAA